MRRSEWIVPGVVVTGVLLTPLARPGVLAPWVGEADALLPLAWLLLAGAAYSVLRGKHVWADPAELTWGGTDRERVIRRQLVRDWAVRFGAVVYAVAAVGMTTGFGDVPPLVLSIALVAPATLAVAWFPTRPARRAQLVRGWAQRRLRSVMTAFGDLVGLLPPARPVPGRVRGAARFVLHGAVARWSALPAAALAVVAGPVLHGAFAQIAAVWWVAIAAYLAALPFAGALAEVHRVPGLRRWVPVSMVALKVWTAVLSAVPALVAVGAATLWGLPFEPLLVPLAAWAVVRTVTRPEIDYAAQGAAEFGGLYLPMGIVRQVVRGPDLVFLGAAVLLVL
ncbi:hypothetical protein ACOBQX_15900 [Actinokineospora sp. G85]|uniref:hypothetical protein n=1 Tax=Actinokineospora sp. G85 TaxID=3406626 RepID=UPI003C7470B1